MKSTTTSSNARRVTVASFSSLGLNPNRQSAAKRAVGVASLRPRVHCFIDFSNIAIAAKEVGVRYGDGVLQCNAVRLHFGNLRQFIQRNRIWAGGYAAAGLMDGRAVKSHAESAGIRFDVCERGCLTNTEQGVDEKLQNEMYRLNALEQSPGVVALATGDGNGYLQGRGFLPILQKFHRDGYQVELMSWSCSLNAAMGDWVRENGRLILLDNWYEELTFVEGGRRAKNMDELNRKLAKDPIIRAID